MKKLHAILFALSVAALFVTGTALGTTGSLVDPNEANENETALEQAIEASEFLVSTPVPAKPVEIISEPAIPGSNAMPSAGIGIEMALLIVLSTVYIFKKRG